VNPGPSGEDAAASANLAMSDQLSRAHGAWIGRHQGAKHLS